MGSSYIKDHKNYKIYTSPCLLFRLFIRAEASMVDEIIRPSLKAGRQPTAAGDYHYVVMIREHALVSPDGIQSGSISTLQLLVIN